MNNFIKYIIAIVLMLIFNTYSIFSQDVTQDLKLVEQFNASVSTMKSALNRMSKNFHYYNKESKEMSDQLLKEILRLSESLSEPRNHFLLHVFDRLDSSQKQNVRDLLPLQISDEDTWYTDLVSIYNLTSHFSRIYSKVDTSSINIIKEQFYSGGYISSYNVEQLKYISTLANLSGDPLYEKDLLLLVEDLYNYTKAIDDDQKRNKLLIVLYNRIAPNSIGKIYSKSSVVNSLYLMEEPTIVKYGGDVGDSRLAWKYVITCVVNKMSQFDERYWNENKFYENIDSIKEELMYDTSIWKSYIAM